MKGVECFLEKNYSRRSRAGTNYSPYKSWLVIVLLLLNTVALATLVVLAFYSFNQSTNQEQRLKTIENKIALLDSNAKKISSSVTETSSAATVKNNPMNTSTSTTTDSSTVNTTQSTESVSSEETQKLNQTEVNINSVEKTYVVQSGDSLSAIAEKHSLSIEELMNKNNLTDSTVLVGQVLTVN